ncbi:hypothetical protein [Williamsia sp. 1135]|uniref:hypothetical protein n=1 Tax=Williamsia sp. 1135 TaxID=1889262 RepID=UPI000A11D5C0|nr:hypothetical protein [Williamsia sp. 1135]ORM29203.1 hypothetical protein BFL43_20435 [Williamsia sp. 1135]
MSSHYTRPTDKHRRSHLGDLERDAAIDLLATIQPECLGDLLDYARAIEHRSIVGPILMPTRPSGLSPRTRARRRNGGA